MARPPLISVVVPLYDGAEWIVDCLDSILAQTFTDFEVVVVDDGSTDLGPALVALSGAPRIRLVSQEAGSSRCSTPTIFGIRKSFPGTCFTSWRGRASA